MKNVGVIGAGTMGQGIANAFATQRTASFSRLVSLCLHRLIRQTRVFCHSFSNWPHYRCQTFYKQKLFLLQIWTRLPLSWNPRSGSFIFPDSFFTKTHPLILDNLTKCVRYKTTWIYRIFINSGNISKNKFYFRQYGEKLVFSRHGTATVLQSVQSIFLLSVLQNILEFSMLLPFQSL